MRIVMLIVVVGEGTIADGSNLMSENCRAGAAALSSFRV